MMRLFAMAAILAATALPVAAQLMPRLAVEAQPAANVASQSLDLTIRFYDKRITFLGDPVSIEAVITNNSADTFRFRLADRRAFNLDLDVRTLTNVRQERAREYITERSTNQPVFFRNVDLEPGEQFGFIVQVERFVNIARSGVYTVRAQFAPDLFSRATNARTAAVLSSNTLTLNVRPPLDVPEMRDVVAAESGMVLTPQPLAPDQVIAATLTARQQSTWPAFFLYMDLESLLLKSPAHERRYRRAPEAERMRMLEQFRADLQQERVENEILLIPTSFDILKTTYTPTTGTVIVDQRFDQGDFTEIRRYTYFLERRDLIWTIIDFDVQNLGTER